MFFCKYNKIFNKIPKNSKICIYGSDATAIELLNVLKNKRPDVQVMFFVNSEKEGCIKSIPVYKCIDIESKLENIDLVVIATYGSRYFIEYILKVFGVSNIIFITKDLIVRNNKKENKKINEYSIDESIKVFKTRKDRTLYKLLDKARNNKEKYKPIMKKFYDKKYKNRLDVLMNEQYFEYLNKDVIKTAIDGGACDGFHSLQMSRIFNDCEKIYLFEPCYDSFKSELYNYLIKKSGNIEIVKQALWKECTNIEFREEFVAKGGSAIIEVKPNIERPHKIITAKAISIDEFVKQNNIKKLDFIKMDIENAELDALKGAENTLVFHRPQLAISIYHSNEHFYNIPKYLYNLLPNYEFHLGHYHPKFFDTVLYAIPKELVK